MTQSRGLRTCRVLSLFLAIVGVASSVHAQWEPPLEAAAVVADAQARFAATLDYDDDGFLDALSVWFPSSVAITIRGYRNDRSGRLVLDWDATFSGISSPAFPTAAAAAGDFNGDGRDDFVLALNDTIGWFRSNGAGAVPTLTWLHQASAIVDEILVADYDGNGLADAAMRSASSLEVWLTPQGGAPQLSSTTPIGAGVTHMLFAADADGDATPDVGTLSTGGPLGATAFVQLFPAATPGVLSSAMSYLLSGVANPMPACGDVDGDGDWDIVVFHMPASGAPYYHVSRRTGPATLVHEAASAGGPATDLADVDLDGDLDGICCSGGGGYGSAPNVGPSKFEISINGGAGQFAPAFPIAALGSTRLAGAADLDHDGDVDLVAGRCIYYGRGPSGVPPFPAALGVEGPRDLADVDDDGDPDFRAVIASSQRNAGDGTFGTPSGLGAPPPPPGRTWAPNGYQGDFDSDGDIDWLLDAIPATPNVLDETHLLRNLGCGVFVDAGIVSPPGQSMSGLPSIFGPTFVAKPEAGLVADLDLDGDLDLVVASPTASPSVSGLGYSRVWWNQAGTAFSMGQDLVGIVAIAAGDVDLDGVVDLFAQQQVVSSYSNLVVLRGTGTSFLLPGAPGSLPLLDNDTRLVNRPAIGDFDGDGDLDVFSLGNTVGRRFLNPGNGVFGTGVPFTSIVAVSVSTSTAAASATPNLAHAVDLDGDGLLDLAVSPLGDNPKGCAIVSNADLVAPTPATDALIKQVFEAKAFVDVDGDGDLDAVGPTTIARNCLFGPAGAGRRLQYGTGIAGAGGIVPILGETGPFRVGSTIELRVRGGVGGAAGYLVLGSAAANAPLLGGTLLATPDQLVPIQLGGAPGVPGAGTLSIPWIAPPQLAWVSFFKQAGFLDPAAPSGVSATNGLLIAIRP